MIFNVVLLDYFFRHREEGAFPDEAIPVSLMEIASVAIAPSQWRGLFYESYNYQHVRANHCHKSYRAKNFLLHFPALAVFQPFQKEILEWVRGFLVGEAVVNIFVIRVRFEPELVSV
jgi:hypothetical protein